MSDIKSVISLLCKHLKFSFNVNIRPEHFRLAKFDKTEESAVVQMWELLYKICSEEFPKLVEDDVVNFVKMSLAMMGYKNIEVYCLPADMSHGSQELLLAFGWILATKNVLEHSVDKSLRHSPLNMEFNNVNQAFVNSPTLQIHKSGSLESSLNSVLWFAGRIRQNINAISELAQARISVATKVHEGTTNVSGLPHLSVSETLLIRNPKLLTDYLSQVSEKYLLIETHKLWGKKCHIFWEWMESVIAEKESKGDLSNLSVDEKRTMFLVVDNLKNKLKCLLTKYENITCNEELQSLQGVPRCLLQSKETNVEMAHLIDDVGKQLEQLKDDLEQKEIEITVQLHDFARKMDHTVVLFPQD
ncbi:hypothetical protein L9F63_001899 [Diploptera punctata]|uniref:Tubulin epsilon and delta complex protein 1 domain-containing protein n=1 Tax=Diploptera punctata TaxID=6984 RepID=A0AAD8A2P5_DIPPU|nr:hypothetical protein L9F63_001899 [Diploptera punctata]